MTLVFQTLGGFFQTNWGWAAGLAGSMLGLTLLAGSLLSPQRKDEIALWLMGAHSQESWSRSFVSLFDAVFGERHFSLRCMLRSTVASLIAVVLIWSLMGNVGALGLRIRAELSLGSVLVLALAVNVVADYVSLLETRYLLGRMHRVRSVLAQFAVLVADLVISAAIIWLAILAYRLSPIYQGEAESFAEILGVFSIFSVAFYSTFLTSVWSWAYILSTWIMRTFKKLRLADWLDVEHKPVRVLAYVLALVVFLGAMALALPMRKDADGLTFADRALCSLFKGRVCLDVAELTPTEKAQLEFIELACEDVTEECLQQGLDTYNVRPEQAARLWRVACEGGDGDSCANLGYLYQFGLGVEGDFAQAARLYRRSCDGGVRTACVNLAYLHIQGLGVDADPPEAARLFQQFCDDKIGAACSSLGQLYVAGMVMDRDLEAGAQFYRMGCELGDATGCTSLGALFEQGIGVEADPTEAARLYRQGCDGGSARGCTSLGYLYRKGIGVDTDLSVASRLYRQGCEAGSALGCMNLGILYEKGTWMDPDPAHAAWLYRKACELGHLVACYMGERITAE